MTLRTLSISRELLAFIVEDCVQRIPEEACGLLVGTYDDAGVNVFDAVPVRNQSMSAIRFSIDPVEMYSILKKAEAIGADIVGVYHSHPAGGEPSHLDINYMQDTSYVWVIVEACGSVRAFVWDREIREVKIEEGAAEAAATLTSRGSG